ncbi:MAG TPA: VOC family protein [Bacteroidota bacterium]|nr:VOC family protein [Bacteroidota bacterium]
MGAPVVHWEINSNNAQRLQEFYSRVFGWTIDTNNPMNYGLVNTGSTLGAHGGIGQNDPSQPVTPPPVTFYIQVSDLQTTLDRVTELGGSVVMPVTEIPNMVTFALFRDPDGNVIGLVKGEEPKPAAKKPRATRARRAAKRKPATRKKAARKRRR